MKCKNRSTRLHRVIDNSATLLGASLRARKKKEKEKKKKKEKETGQKACKYIFCLLWRLNVHAARRVQIVHACTIVHACKKYTIVLLHNVQFHQLVLDQSSTAKMCSCIT